MKIHRTVPPTAASIHLKDLLHGIAGIFFGDRYIKKLESGIKEYFGVQYVFFASSGKAALTLILLALKRLSGKNQVVIPAYTCFSVPSAIVKAGLEVALCDIDPVTLDFDRKLLGEAVSEDTLCVIPNHLFGIPTDVDRINAVCKERGIFVVEDAAQAMGGTYKERKLGTIGDVGFFSLGRGKNITCGCGGIIVTNSDRIAQAIAEDYSNLDNPASLEVFKEFLQVMLMWFFIHPSLYWFPAGMSFLKLGQTLFYKDFPVKKMSGMKAGLLWNWRKRLEQSNQARTEIAVYFAKRLRLNTKRGRSIPYLRLPVIVDSRETRNRIYLLSNEYGLGISLMYPSAINEIKEIKANFSGKVFPSSRKIAERLLTLPTHHLLSEKDKETICELFNKAGLSEVFPDYQKADSQ